MIWEEITKFYSKQGISQPCFTPDFITASQGVTAYLGRHIFLGLFWLQILQQNYAPGHRSGSALPWPVSPDPGGEIDQIEIPRGQKYIQSIPGSIPDIGSEMLGKQIYRYSFGINHVGDRYLRVRHREQIIGRKESSSSKRPIPVRDILQGTQFVGK